MDCALDELKAELERFGEDNDRAANDRSRCMLNITRDTGEFLSVLVRATNARRILEIGTSNGYSTLWLAEAAQATGGSVTTVESSKHKLELASVTFARSGLASIIQALHDEAGNVLQRATESTFDLVFLDADRSQYPPWWSNLRRILRPGGLLIVDNATSHVDELAPFVALVKADATFVTCLVPVGKGEFIVLKPNV